LSDATGGRRCDPGESRLDCYRRWHALAGPYFEWQLRQFTPFLGARVADVGCGVGNFCGYLLDRELYLGIDLDPDLTGEQQSEFGAASNVEIVQGDITEASGRDLLVSRRVDSILCVNVIEHIENDRQAIANMVAALPSGGTLCLLVPAMGWLYGTLDALDGHYRRYQKPMLRERLSAFPLELLRLYYFNMVGALGWFVKGRILKETRQAEENYRAMNLLVPLVSRVERLCPPPFGLSLIAIARKH
jgi:SAM-dependent methyltransferase